MLYFYRISFNMLIFSPSPPTINLTFGYLRTIAGIISTSKSTPFLYVSRHIDTMLIVFFGFYNCGFGVNLHVSTAFGITKILSGFTAALSAKFSLFVYETHIVAST